MFRNHRIFAANLIPVQAGMNAAEQRQCGELHRQHDLGDRRGFEIRQACWTTGGVRHLAGSGWRRLIAILVQHSEDSVKVPLPSNLSIDLSACQPPVGQTGRAASVANWSSMKLATIDRWRHLDCGDRYCPRCRNDLLLRSRNHHRRRRGPSISSRPGSNGWAPSRRPTSAMPSRKPPRSSGSTRRS